MQLIVALVLVLAGSLGFLAALDAGALIILLLAKIGQNTGLGAAALESLKSVIQRLVLLDMDFRHLFSLPPNTPCGALRAISMCNGFSRDIITGLPHIVKDCFFQ